MIQPREHVFGTIDFHPVGQGGPVDHQHRHTQFARGNQLGFGAYAAGVLANHQIDGVGLHERAVAFRRERPVIHDQGVPGQGGRLVRRIDEAQKIVVLRLGSEGVHMHASQCQHDAAGGAGEGGNCAVDVGNAAPAITRDGLPGRTGQGDEGNAHFPCRRYRMCAHRRRKGVGGVDEMGDRAVAQIGGETCHTTEAADPHRHRLGAGIIRSTGIAERCRDARVRQQACQRAGLRRAAQQEDVGHG